MSLTVSLGQTVLSDTCLTTAQIDFFIEQCYTVKEQQNTIIERDSTIATLLYVVDNDGTIIMEKDNEIELLREQKKDVVNDCTIDKKKLQDQINLLSKKDLWHKIGSYITTPLAIIGGAKLTYDYLK